MYLLSVGCRSIPFLTPSHGSSSPALHVPAWLTDMRNTQYRPDMAATTLLPHNYQTEKVQSRQHCHHLHLPSSTIFSPAPCQHLNLNLIPSALTGTVCCLDLSPPLERPDHTIPALEAPCFNWFLVLSVKKHMVCMSFIAVQNWLLHINMLL